MTIFTAERDLEVFFINAQGDYETTTAGIRLDNSPRTKALLALKAKRGQYWYDRNYGSRYWTIKTLRDGERLALPYAQEALQFMIDRGEILGVELVEVSQNPATGSLNVHLALEVTEDDIVDVLVQKELP